MKQQPACGGSNPTAAQKKAAKAVVVPADQTRLRKNGNFRGTGYINKKETSSVKRRTSKKGSNRNCPKRGDRTNKYR